MRGARARGTPGPPGSASGRPAETGTTPYDELQPRPAVRNFLNALARWFQAVPFRVVDDAPRLRDLVIISVGDPNAALGDEPLDQLMS
ncbi:hypothetical protein GCM10010236_09120 [Streptomyces eurythermus]|nr:hypothetical protein GCM10010236_09120 [Streptomyces eurythermus]